MEEKEKKVKVRVISERDTQKIEEAPPNFYDWFLCEEKWDRFDKND